MFKEEGSLEAPTPLRQNQDITNQEAYSEARKQNDCDPFNQKFEELARTEETQGRF